MVGERDRVRNSRFPPRDAGTIAGELCVRSFAVFQSSHLDLMRNELFDLRWEFDSSSFLISSNL